MSENKTIYIADDEANIRLGIKTFLENAGYAVEEFASGDLLLAAFAENPADLVILDVMMPGANGFVVCKELRKISHVPIIMLTARDSDLDYATGLDLGSDDYLTKPFSPMALTMRIKAIFRRMEFERQAHAGDGAPHENEEN
ncbi:MAG: response regulator transcription factor [Oscillospiraceae bacterium]|nr:response regulator transcription factor [Oscillospiraceae bacterium]